MPAVLRQDKNCAAGAASHIGQPGASITLRIVTFGLGDLSNEEYTSRPLKKPCGLCHHLGASSGDAEIAPGLECGYPKTGLRVMMALRKWVGCARRESGHGVCCLRCCAA